MRADKRQRWIAVNPVIGFAQVKPAACEMMRKPLSASPVCNELKEFESPPVIARDVHAIAPSIVAAAKLRILLQRYPEWHFGCPIALISRR